MTDDARLDVELTDVITAAELRATAREIASLQLPNGMIPWFEGGHCDPWNHVETAMALDVMGMHDSARRAYRWLAATQRPDGSWHNYYLPDGSIEDPKLDTNVCAYVATGLWHHWLCNDDRDFVHELWPVVDRALGWVLGMRRADGLVLWAREVDSTPWDYALLTGSSSIRHALHCGSRLASLLGEERPDWSSAADTIDDAVASRPSAFEPKDRWAMDWYYPILTGAIDGRLAQERLTSGWSAFAMRGSGIRCVNDEEWVTAAETAECALAHATVGDTDVARELLAWTRAHRTPTGRYLTGLVYPDRVVFPADETSAYTGAAVILAADAIAGISPAHALFLNSVVGG